MKSIKLFLIFIFLFSNFIFIFSEEDKIKTKYAISFGDNLFFRKGPSKKDAVILKLQKGDIVEIISSTKEKEKINEMDDFWYNVKFKNKTGYVYGFYLGGLTESPIVVSEKTGLIFFLNKIKKVINQIQYKSNFLEIQMIKKEGKNRKDVLYDIPEIIDNFLIIKNVSGWYQSEYIVNYYSIYNKEGKKICKINEMPILCISNKNKFLIVNITGNNTNSKNKIEIYKYDGKLLKTINYIKNKPDKEFKFNNDKFLFDNGENYYIWVTNTSSLVINLKTLKDEVIYYDLNDFSQEKNLIDVVEAAINNRILKISLSIEPVIKSNSKTEKRIVKINIDLLKY